MAASSISSRLSVKPRMRSPRDDLSFAEKLVLAIDNPVLRRELLTALRSQKAFTLHFFFLFALAALAVGLRAGEVDREAAGERTGDVFEWPA